MRAEAAGSFSIQVGSPSDTARVNKLLSRLNSAGFDCRAVEAGELSRVLCGSFGSESEGQPYLNRLVSRGYLDSDFVRSPDGVVFEETPANTRALPARTNSIDATGAAGNLSGNLNANINVRYSVQVGSLSEKARVNKLVSRLRTSGFQCEALPKDGLFRVLCGDFAGRSAGNTMLNKLRSLGYADAFFVALAPGEMPYYTEGEKFVNTTVLPSNTTYAKNSVELVSKPMDETAEGNLGYNASMAQRQSIQVGRLSDKARAQKLISRLRTNSLGCTAMPSQGQYRVLCGDFQTQGMGQQMLYKLKSIGYADAFFVALAPGEMPYYTEGEKFVNTTVLSSNTMQMKNTADMAGHANTNRNLNLNILDEEYYAVQVGRIADKARVAKLLSRLRSGGFECVDDKQEFDYRVLCGRFVSTATGEQYLNKLRSVGYEDAFFVLVQPEGGFSFDANPYAIAELPPLETSSSISGDIFERDGGHFHPFGGLLVKFTDNLYYDATAPEDDIVTYLNVGFWAASPAIKEPLADVFTVNFMSGRLRSLYAVPRDSAGRRHLLYASAKTYGESFSRHSYEDFNGFDSNVYMGYEFPAGHRVSLGHQYIASRTFGDNTATLSGVGEYTSNKVAISARARVSGRIFLRLESQSYDVSYSMAGEEINDRTDSTTKAGVELIISSKTTLLIEGSVREVDYADPTRLDREEGDASLGMYWNLSGKTDGFIKGGAYTNQFTGAGGSDSFSYFTGSVNYRMSAKSLLRLEYSTDRQDSDFNQAGNTYAIMKRQALTFEWKPRAKWRTSTLLETTTSDYYTSGVLNAGSDDKQRLSVDIKYQVTRWLGANLVVSSPERSSSLAGRNYKANEILVGVSTSF